MKAILHTSGLFLLILLTTGVAIAEDPATQPATPDKKAVVDGNTFTTDDGETWFICPVKGNPTPIEGAVAASMVDGTRYYHCCFSSQAPFRADPGKHLNDGFFVPANLTRITDNGSAFRDPVTGQTKMLQDDTLHHTIGHRRYFFVSKESMTKFVANPDDYIKSED